LEIVFARYGPSSWGMLIYRDKTSMMPMIAVVEI
jgi:hypothetical protein